MDKVVPLDTLIFDASACGYPKSRVPPLPVGLAGLSLDPRHEAPWAPPANFRHFARSRYGLREACRLAGVGPGSALLAPAYHCRDMLDPALALGGEVLLYPLGRDLAPDIAALIDLIACSPNPVRAILVAHFFGIPQPLDVLSSWCNTHGIILIEDGSHAFFCEQHRPPGVGIAGDFVISSPYKFLPSPNGGLLYAPDANKLSDITPRNPSFLDELGGIARGLSKAKEYRRGRKSCDTACIDDELAAIARNPGPQARELYQKATCSNDYHPEYEQLASLRCSRLAYRHADIERIAHRRRAIYRRWTEATSDLPFSRPLVPKLPDGCIPYMYPLYIDRPAPNFHYLKHLGFPAWRWDSIAASNCPTANHLSPAPAAPALPSVA